MPFPISYALSSPINCLTHSRLNSRAVPAPCPVIQLPDTTTRSSAFVASLIRSLNAGWHVATTPSSNPWGWRATTGAAHCAENHLPSAFYFWSKATRLASSCKFWAPGIPPGTMIKSNVWSVKLLMRSSATMFIPLLNLMVREVPAAASITSAYALRNTLTGVIVSISSLPSATATKTRTIFIFTVGAIETIVRYLN